MTGMGAALVTAKVEFGSSVVVIGCGGVGLNIIQGARVAGAHKIIGIDLMDNKLEYAKQFGATHVINGSDGDPVAKVKEITGGKGADYAFDAIGLGKVLEQCFACVRVGGMAVEVGVSPITMSESKCAVRQAMKLTPMFKAAAIPTFLLSMHEKTIKGSFYGSARPGVDMIRILNLYQSVGPLSASFSTWN